MLMQDVNDELKKKIKIKKKEIFLYTSYFY